MKNIDTHSNLSNKLNTVLNRLVDDKTGIIKQLVEVPLQTTESLLFIFSAECSDTHYATTFEYSDRGRAEQLASGAALDREEALWSTIGEACERYIASCFFVENSFYKSEKELLSDAVPLSDFVLFSDSQYSQKDFEFSRPEPTKPLYWDKGYSLHNNSTAYLPSQLVWLGFPHKDDSEVMFTQISTGLAAGSTLKHAELTGLREVIERDAFTTHWMLRHSPKKIRNEDIAERHPKLKLLLANENLDFSLLWMQTDIDIPCVLCIITLPKQAGIAIGMSCHLDCIAATEKAVVEALHTYNWILEMRRSSFPATSKIEIKDFEHHIRFYFDSKNHHILDFLFDGDYLPSEELDRHVFPNNNHSRQLTEVLTRIERAGYHAYGVDISKAEFTEIDIYAAKAVIPGLQPLHVGLGNEYLDRKRLLHIARKWNIDFPNTLNLEPHPFP